MEELGAVEREVDKLEKKVEQLKFNLDKEREQRLRRLCQQNLLFNGPETNAHRSKSQRYDELRKDMMMLSERRFSSSAASDIQITMSSIANHQSSHLAGACDVGAWKNATRTRKEAFIETPNELSEHLIKCLISIYLDLNQPSHNSQTKHGLSCINSKTNPYTILLDPEGSVKDIGPYKNFIHITRTSFDIRRLPECSPSMRKLR